MKDLATPFVEMYLALLVGALALAGVALAFSLRTQARSLLGLGLLLVTAVLVPFHLGDTAGGVSGPLVMAGALCVAWLLQQLVRRRVALDGSRVVMAVVAFMAVAILSFVVGQYPWFPTAHAPMRAQLGGLGLFLLSGSVFLLIGHQVGRLTQLRRLTWVFIASGTLLVVMLIIGWPDVKVGRIGITSSQSIGSMFFVWLVAMSISQGLCNRDLPPPLRFTMVAAGALTLARSLFLAFSWASGWLPPLVAVAVIVFVRYPRTALGASLLGIVPVMLFGDRVFAALLEGGESYSWMTRLEAFRVILQVVVHNPLLGFGPANYSHYTVLFPILGWWVQFSSHNNYLDLVAQTGLVGLLVFFWFVAEVFLLAMRLRWRVPAGFARAYVIGVMGGLAGSLVAALLADWVIPFAYNIGLRGFRSSVLFWFFLGGLLAIKRMSASPSAMGAAVPRAEPLFPAAGPLKAAAPLAFKDMA